jgi:hypothetical protein
MSDTDIELTIAANHAKLDADLAAAQAQVRSFAAATQRLTIEAQRSTGAAGASAAREEAADVIAAAQEAARGRIEAAQLAFERTKLLLDGQVQQDLITHAQEDALLQQASAKRYADQIAVLAEEEQIDGLKLRQRQRLQDQIDWLMAESANKEIEYANKIAADQKKAWQESANSIENAFNGQLRGLLSGQETWGQAMQKILGDLVIKAIEGFEKMGVEWATTQLSMTSTATSAAAAQSAAQASGATAGLLPTLSADAAKVFGNVFAFLSPVLGPAAAAPATAASASVLAAVPALDVGGYVLSDGLARIHAGETIVPANVASPYAGGGGPGRNGAGGVAVNPTTNFHISALDGASVAQWARDNGATLAKSIDQAARHGALLGLRRLAPG